MEDPFRPSLDIPAQDGMEHPLLGSGMLSIELLDQFLSVLAFGISVYRTLFLQSREIVLMLKTDHIRLIQEHQGTYDGQVHPIQIGLWGKGMEPAFKNEGQEHGFDDIVHMMAVSHLIAAHFLHSLIQSAFAHFRAQRAGIGFLTYIKEDLVDIRSNDPVWNLHRAA